jgi:hypothetical protein
MDELIHPTDEVLDAPVEPGETASEEKKEEAA